MYVVRCISSQTRTYRCTYICRDAGTRTDMHMYVCNIYIYIYIYYICIYVYIYLFMYLYDYKRSRCGRPPPLLPPSLPPPSPPSLPPSPLFLFGSTLSPSAPVVWWCGSQFGSPWVFRNRRHHRHVPFLGQLPQETGLTGTRSESQMHFQYAHGRVLGGKCPLSQGSGVCGTRSSLQMVELDPPRGNQHPTCKLRMDIALWLKYRLLWHEFMFASKARGPKSQNSKV